MREVVTIRSCDFCYEATDEKVPVEHTFTIGICVGEERPALYVAETCAVHGKPLQDLLGQLGILQPYLVSKPSTTSATAKPAAAEGEKTYKTARVECGICQANVAVNSLATHIWQHHVPTDMPKQPGRCPNCVFRSESAVGMASHRRLNHGWNAVAEAYAAAGHEVSA